MLERWEHWRRRANMAAEFADSCNPEPWDTQSACHLGITLGPSVTHTVQCQRCCEISAQFDGRLVPSIARGKCHVGWHRRPHAGRRLAGTKADLAKILQCCITRVPHRH
jgi:hypothetical protein